MSAWSEVSMSDVAARTSNPIRLLVDRGAVEPNPALPVIKLSIGDPTVDGNFLPPANADVAVKQAVDSHKANGYAPSHGAGDARKAIAEKYTLPDCPVTENDVVLACGCSGALDLAIRVLCNAGQEILLPSPGFSLYNTICETSGIAPVFYQCLPEKD
eukprot:PhM_4_TR11261/c1_g1_i1/m.12233/K00815/TAT; tyrosine aminotransferase